jgi:hypothetical protein
MNMTAAEARAESESSEGVIKTYWHEMARRGGPPPSSSRPRPSRAVPFVQVVPKTLRREEPAGGANLRQNLAHEQAEAEVTALRAQVTQLEAQIAAQSRAGTMAQETIQIARWDWLGRGFIGGCVMTIGFFGAFVLYFTG